MPAPGPAAAAASGHASRVGPAALAAGLAATVALLGGPLAGPAAAAGSRVGPVAVAGVRAAGPVTVGAPVPAAPTGLPADLEGPSPYLPQVSCDPVAKPGTLALARLLAATYPGTTSGIARACAADGLASEHYEGRALDWTTSVRDPQGAARAQALLGWLLAPDAAGHPFANARRLGVMYLIWDDRIWGSYATAAGWRPYSSCAAHPEPAADTGCHRDHVHVSLSWAGALGRTSFWTGRVAPVDYGPCRPADLNWAPPYRDLNPVPCPVVPAVTAAAGSPAVAVALARYSGATVGPGSTGPVVTAVQRALGVAADGTFGPMTAAAVTAFRAAHVLAPGAGVDAAMWRVLLTAAAAAPPAGVPPAGAQPPPPAGPAAAGSPSPAGGAAPADGARPVIGYGSRGASVLIVQRALHVVPRSGWFGPVTRTAVARFQTAHRLPPTGVVTAATWRALAA